MNKILARLFNPSLSFPQVVGLQKSLPPRRDRILSAEVEVYHRGEECLPPRRDKLIFLSTGARYLLLREPNERRHPGRTSKIESKRLALYRLFANFARCNERVRTNTRAMKMFTTYE